VSLKRLLVVGLTGWPLILSFALAGPIRQDQAPDSTGLTGGTAAGPCQSLFDSSSVPGCPGAGAGQGSQSASLDALSVDGSSLDGPSPDSSGGNGARLLFRADDGGIFGSTIFPGWGYNGSTNPDPGSGGSYLTPSGGPPPGLGQPPDSGDPAPDGEESMPEPSALWLTASGLIAAGLFRRKLARGAAARR